MDKHMHIPDKREKNVIIIMIQETLKSVEEALFCVLHQFNTKSPRLSGSLPDTEKNLPVSRIGHQISQVWKKVLKVHFSHFF